MKLFLLLLLCLSSSLGYASPITNGYRSRVSNGVEISTIYILIKTNFFDVLAYFFYPGSRSDSARSPVLSTGQVLLLIFWDILRTVLELIIFFQLGHSNSVIEDICQSWNVWSGGGNGGSLRHFVHHWFSQVSSKSKFDKFHYSKLYFTKSSLKDNMLYIFHVLDQRQAHISTCVFSILSVDLDCQELQVSKISYYC